MIRETIREPLKWHSDLLECRSGCRDISNDGLDLTPDYIKAMRMASKMTPNFSQLFFIQLSSSGSQPPSERFLTRQ